MSRHRSPTGPGRAALPTGVSVWGAIEAVCASVAFLKVTVRCFIFRAQGSEIACKTCVCMSRLPAAPAGSRRVACCCRVCRSLFFSAAAGVSFSAARSPDRASEPRTSTAPAAAPAGSPRRVACCCRVVVCSRSAATWSWSRRAVARSRVRASALDCSCRSACWVSASRLLLSGLSFAFLSAAAWVSVS